MARNHDSAYHCLHQWMNRHFPRTGRCEYCGGRPRRTEYASTRQTRNRADWFELCVPCHQAFDQYAVQRAGGRRPKSASHRAAISKSMRDRRRK